MRFFASKQLNYEFNFSVMKISLFLSELMIDWLNSISDTIWIWNNNNNKFIHSCDID